MSFALIETSSAIPIGFGTEIARHDSDFLNTSGQEKQDQLHKKVYNKEKLIDEIHTTSSNIFSNEEKNYQRSNEKKSKNTHTVVSDSKVKKTRGKLSGYQTVQNVQRLQQIAEDWLDELRSSSDDANDVAEYTETEKLDKNVKENELRYTLLAKFTRKYQSSCIRAMTESERVDRKKNKEIRKIVEEKQVYKFLFLVDNSGSMNGEKMTYALNILVVLLEALKKMEYQTAVVRFGGEETQSLLKDFTDEMDQKRGHYIIESFDSREKTLVLDALKFVAKETGYKCIKKPNEHRFIILITDGIWEQTNKTFYNQYLKEAGDPRLLILTTLPEQDKSLNYYNKSKKEAKRVLDDIAEKKWLPLEPEKDFGETIIDVATLIDNHLRVIANDLKPPLQNSFSPIKVS